MLPPQIYCALRDSPISRGADGPATTTGRSGYQSLSKCVDQPLLGDDLGDHDDITLLGGFTVVVSTPLLQVVELDGSPLSEGADADGARLGCFVRQSGEKFNRRSPLTSGKILEWGELYGRLRHNANPCDFEKFVLTHPSQALPSLHAPIVSQRIALVK